MMRIACLFLVSAVLALQAVERTTPIVVEDLHGAWVVDTKHLKPEQQEAAKAAATVEFYGVNFTQKTCRVILAEDNSFAGMWRIDDATPTTATITVYPKGQEERRFPISFDGTTLVLTDAPGKLPLIKAPR
jgi:hypothetical protein